jgi:HAMP domain-containing protein
LAIHERNRAIFSAYCYEGRSLDEIGRTYRLSPNQVRRIVDEVEARPGRVRAADAKSLGLESAVEDLGLRVRVSNALRRLGCNTVEDVLRLDLSSSVRGLGPKAKEELLTRLERAGFHHPTRGEESAEEIRILERSLERMRSRIDAALGAMAKEIRQAKERLRKRTATRGAGKVSTAGNDSTPGSAFD